MLKLSLQILRSIAAAVAGYMVIVAGTTLAFEVWLGGVGYHESPPYELLLASGAAVLSGLSGGFVAAWVANRQPLFHAIGVLAFLIADTTYVLTSGISKEPLWFSLLSSLTLMAST
ncbi:MAG TPA: hypothetical protein VJQ56_16395, partial [Blastocatellia bacterium]|nr:hypothetical protein [Blastocatellia bacterium]